LLASELLRRVNWQKFNDVSEVLSSIIIMALIVLMMVAASTSETSVNFYQTTRHNNSEDIHLHTCRHVNLKSHNITLNSVHNLPSSHVLYISGKIEICKTKAT
jgi:hypothetical protein